MGDFRVLGSVRMSGLVTGTILVRDGGTLHLNGTCGKDLVVETGGIAIVDGLVSGNVINSGSVELRGTVVGDVQTRGGNFQRSPSAVVHGVVIP